MARVRVPSARRRSSWSTEGLVAGECMLSCRCPREDTILEGWRWLTIVMFHATPAAATVVDAAAAEREWPGMVPYAERVAVSYRGSHAECGRRSAKPRC